MEKILWKISHLGGGEENAGIRIQNECHASVFASGPHEICTVNEYQGIPSPPFDSYET